MFDPNIQRDTVVSRSSVNPCCTNTWRDSGWNFARVRVWRATIWQVWLLTAGMVLKESLKAREIVQTHFWSPGISCDSHFILIHHETSDHVRYKATWKSALVLSVTSVDQNDPGTWKRFCWFPCCWKVIQHNMFFAFWSRYVFWQGGLYLTHILMSQNLLLAGFKLVEIHITLRSNKNI